MAGALSLTDVVAKVMLNMRIIMVTWLPLPSVPMLAFVNDEE